jgi:hypothetical protein
MKLFSSTRWVNFLSLLPGTTLSILVISIAFLRSYDERDFTILGIITDSRSWSNRLTLAALVFALANFGGIPIIANSTSVATSVWDGKPKA